MDNPARSALIEQVIAKLCERYIFPELTTRMGATLRARQVDGAYRGLTPEQFARTLSDDLYAIAADKHLWVRYREPGGAHGQPPTHEQAALTNFGFGRVERLAGNVGCLELQAIGPPGWVSARLAAALTLLQDTSALILDLRENGGGYAETVALVCSYFLPADPPTLVNTIHYRETDLTEEMWTTADLPGPRYLNRPLYVLTSNRTFSGAEELAYNLRHLGRATLIGEATRGGAHPTMTHSLDEDFSVSVPYARSINPITGTNWEGVGVIPQVRTLAGQALKTAHLLALEALLLGPHVPALEVEWRETAATLKAQRVGAGRSTAYSQDRATPLQVIL